MVPSHQVKQQAKKIAFREALAAKGRIKVLGLTLDDYIKYFFGGNAWIAIIVLTLIMVFLFKEGAEFFPDNRNSLQLYRKAGLEFVDLADNQINNFTAVNRDLSRLRLRLLEKLEAEGKAPDEANALLADFDRFTASFAGAITPTRTLVDSWKDQVLELKGTQVNNMNFEVAAHIARESGDEAQGKEYEAKILPVDFKTMEALLKNSANLGLYRQLTEEMGIHVRKLFAEVKMVAPEEIQTALAAQAAAGVERTAMEGAATEAGPSAAGEEAEVAAPASGQSALMLEALAMMESGSNVEGAEAVEIPALKPIAGPFLIPAGLEGRLAQTKAKAEDYLEGLPAAADAMQGWDPDKPVSFVDSIGSFAFGLRWLTNSFWQDFYGILPLFFGSLLISMVALVIAVPLSMAAGIYINQLASKAEQNIVKPYIEFIGAIPSVVLGFFGIAVLGTALRAVSQLEWMAWVPGFPMSERLNILTAGVLLAFMAIPTIFTLVEDALNNVPRYFVEASYALGANKIQTIFRIMIPAALSGIIAAVLLGFGRVIGETMVVLLCAGNRIIVPDFMEGIGIFFQPTHTMTGIIAQEMGEVDQGSLHYRALFMVGMMLFLISLGLNYLAQMVVKKFRIGD
jgi:phosphate transport system permease protein